MTTIKTDLFNSRQRKALEIVAVVLDENYNTIDAICPGEGNHRTAIEWAEWRAKTIRDTYEDAAVIAVYCGNDRVANVELDPIETAEETSTETEEVVKNSDDAWEKMSYAAVNVAMVIDNTEYIYTRYKEPLKRCLMKKAAKGVALCPNHLAGCSMMKSIIREGVKELKRISYEPINITTEDRKTIANYFALRMIEAV